MISGTARPKHNVQSPRIMNYLNLSTLLAQVSTETDTEVVVTQASPVFTAILLGLMILGIVNFFGLEPAAVAAAKSLVG